MQPHLAGNLQYPVFPHRQSGSGLVVGVVGERDHGVQPVVAAGHLHHYQYPASRFGLVSSRANGPAPDTWQGYPD